MQKIFLVHGEIDQQEAFRDGLKSLNFKDIEIPVKGQEFEI